MTSNHALVHIDDPDDPRIQQFRLRERGLASRAERREPSGVGLFAAEGDLVVERALAAGCRPLAAICRGDRPPAVVNQFPADVPVFAAGDDLRRIVTGLGVPFDVVGLFERPSPSAVDEVITMCHRLLVVEAVDNPTNLGVLVRSAVGLGWEGLLLDPTSADPLSRRAVRTSMGTVFGLRWARSRDLVSDLRRLHGAEVLTVALTPASDAIDLRLVTVERPHQRVALVVGSERAGLSPDMQSGCAVRARIPMAQGVDSLNVAAAAAIACHHLGP